MISTANGFLAASPNNPLPSATRFFPKNHDDHQQMRSLVGNPLPLLYGSISIA
jgi:hypothetical protein